jgi:methylenetetrahydrofolate dehydrogenase (NADP+)/methenyltetrahydrofolate cyclohydrolase
MRSDTHRLPETTSQADLLALIAELNADAGIHGILVQLPLPATSTVPWCWTPSTRTRTWTASTSSTPDGSRSACRAGPLHPAGVGHAAQGHELGDLSGLNAVIVGRSNIVGKPMAQLLLAQNCTVTIAHSRTRDLPALCREADILVAAVGRPEMMRGDWIKPGATVIDVGINRVPSADPVKAAEGKTRVVGDVAFDEAAAVAGPSPRCPAASGPMTIACLLANTYVAACRANSVTPEPLDA